ncbi:CinA family protein [Verticiella alkaliphila]|uniref:CinA family protein n=1 Tax=Verticiella alkaliphila TaxID=2779529 RepID=UPI00353009F2
MFTAWEAAMSPEQSLVDFMQENELLLVTAESCTAGLIASTLAEVPGAGQLLDCAFVVYSPEAKQRCLAVRAETIERAGLTSEDVAREMAIGALAASRANVAVANTGVADDGADGVAPGTQCFAWAYQCGDDPAVVHVETRRFPGDRHAVREAAAAYALSRIPFYYGAKRP